MNYMPRQARIDIVGQLYHVIARGIERRDIFQESADYLDFLYTFESVARGISEGFGWTEEIQMERARRYDGETEGGFY